MRAACRKQRSRRGFTLVEMLAVVAIIGILVSLITAAAYNARLRVKITQIGVECKELEGSCLGAYREKFGMMPTDFTGTGTAPSAVAGESDGGGDGDDLERVLQDLGAAPAHARTSAEAARTALGPDADFQELLRHALQTRS